ncbi:hypothetical protein [Glutamicibacter sp. MCAF14]|uniref:hypothetical protein n=1 Tax=Glutamicibacter sp. MCAF14 TaxID=3233043 RepID=UPI003F904744
MSRLLPDNETTLELDGVEQEPELNPATGPEEEAEERPFSYLYAEQWLRWYVLPRYSRKQRPSWRP